MNIKEYKAKVLKSNHNKKDYVLALQQAIEEYNEIATTGVVPSSTIDQLFRAHYSGIIQQLVV